MALNQSGFLLAAIIACWTAGGSTAGADWVSCQNKPTRDCLLEEAFRGDSGPLTGKDRLEIMIAGGALTYPDWVTAADVAEAVRLAQSASKMTGFNLFYAYLAIHGLVAANQKQQAIDLVDSLSGTLQELSIDELVRDLVKAGDLQTALALPNQIQLPGDPNIRRGIIASAVKTLAEIGKIDQALTLIADQMYFPEAATADMQAAVGLAYAKRGDAKLAQGIFDQAAKNLEAAQRHAVAAARQHAMALPALDTRLRFAVIRILALRGEVDAVNAAVALERSSADAVASDARTDYERNQGYQIVVRALLDAKQPEAALNLAKSLIPDAAKETALSAVAFWDAANDRLADARAVYSSMDKEQETARVFVVRNLAIFSTKAGDVASALQFASELKNPSNRRGMLFAIAHTLPQ
jgi:hypothetical protein